MSSLKVVASNATKQQPQRRGIFDGGRDARLPDGGLGRPPPSLQVRTAIGAVQNPKEGHQNERIQVTVSTRDVLLDQLSNRRIEESEFAAGRLMQAMWERGSGARLGSAMGRLEGSGGSSSETRLLQMCRAVADAHTVGAFNEKLTSIIGSAGVEFLRLFLIDGWTFQQRLVRERVKVTEREVAKLTGRFKWLLGEVAAKFNL